MESVETEARLDLIKITANAVGGEHDSPHGDEDDQLLDLIEILCLHRDRPVSTSLTEATIPILRERAGDAFETWIETHEIELAESTEPG